MIFSHLHVFPAIRNLLADRKPFQVAVFYLCFLLFAGFSTGNSPVAEQINRQSDPRSCICRSIDFTVQGTAGECQKTFSLPWIEKNDLQENLLRRVEENDCLLILETSEWPISRVILPAEKPAPPIFKDIDLCSQLIRAGPAI